MCDDSTSFYAGAKFSSGVLPPEMMYALKDDNEMEQFESYFADARESDSQLWEKIQPKILLLL